MALFPKKNIDSTCSNEAKNVFFIENLNERIQLRVPTSKSSDFNADSYVIGPVDHEYEVRFSCGVMLGSEPDTALYSFKRVSDVSAVSYPLYAIDDGESNAV